MSVNICKGEDIKSVYEKVDRIIAIGDVHGDYQMLIDALILGKVIDEKGKWIGGKTVVVQVGDQVDRCRPTPTDQCISDITSNDENSDLKTIEYMNELHKKAKKEGGAVYSVLGNHEIMNIQGNMDYVSKAGIDGFGGVEGRRKVFKKNGEVANMIACTRNSILQIGSNIFVHGGVLPSLLEKYGSDISKINKTIRNLLTNNTNEYLTHELLNSDKISPFWTRVFGEKEDDKMCAINDKALDMLKGVKVAVIGHTPQPFSVGKLINSVCGGKIYRIDIGGSQAFELYKNKSYTLQVLEILNDNVFNILEKKKMLGGRPNKKYRLKKTK